MSVEAVVGVIIRIPREAVIPLGIGVVALVTLLVFGTKLAAWKVRSPAAATRFALAAAGLLTACAVFFLLRCLTNQSDPNNEGAHNINFTDAPIAGFLGAIGAAFWRMASQRLVTLIVGVGLGALMIAKPFVWPVIRVTEYGSGARGMLDPEHLMFWGPGVVVVIVAVIAAAKR